MNIYEKLQTIRCELQALGLKKSGKNAFAGYDYYELGDFIPHVNQLMKKHQVTSVLNYDKEKATLEIINCEAPEERIVFTSPMAKAVLKGCHDVQNLGASETYISRYLHQAAFMIVESDVVEASEPIELIADEQLNLLRDNIVSLGIDEEKFCKFLRIDALEKLQAARFQDALNAIEAKRRVVEKGVQ
jgi:hypothetical protein